MKKQSLQKKQFNQAGSNLDFITYFHVSGLNLAKNQLQKSVCVYFYKDKRSSQYSYKLRHKKIVVKEWSLLNSGKQKNILFDLDYMKSDLYNTYSAII